MRSVLLFLFMAGALSCRMSKNSSEALPSASNSNPPQSDTASGLEACAFFDIQKDSWGHTIYQWRNVRYFFHTALLSDIPVEYLVEEIREIRENREQGCKEGQLDLKFYKIIKEREQAFRIYHSPAVSYEIVGSSGHLFRTDIRTCNEALLPVHELYSLKSDQPLLVYYRKMNILTLPANQVKRYIGFQPYRSAIPPVDKKDGKNLVGILYYSSDKGPGRSLALRCKDSVLLEKLRAAPPQIFLTVERNGQLVRTTDMELYPDSGGEPILEPHGFNIEINMVRATGLAPLQLPVLNDRPRPDLLKNAEKGFEMETLR